MERLDAVAYYLTQWGVVETVRQGIDKASPRGPGYTGGGGARAVCGASVMVCGENDCGIQQATPNADFHPTGRGLVWDAEWGMGRVGLFV